MKIKKIKSFEHACEVLGVTIDLETFKTLAIPGKDVQPLIDQYQLWVITEANNKLNKWKADWANSNQPKYSIWGPRVVKDESRPAGFGLVFDDAVSRVTRTIVGARLNVGTSEEAEYIFNDFIELWNSAWLIN